MGIIFEELINSSVTAKDSQDVLKQVGNLLFEHGFVRETYIRAAIEREKSFPTGLKLKNIAIAMPHTDSIHVNKPAICIARLNNTVLFNHMGYSEVSVDAELIFMMAITDPDEQIQTLKKAMEVFQSDQAVSEFKNAAVNEELYLVAKKYLD